MNTTERGKSLQQYEIDYICKNASTSTAQEIADYLGRSTCVVYRFCNDHKLTLKKGVRGRKKGLSPDKNKSVLKKVNIAPPPIIKHIRMYVDDEPVRIERPKAVYTNIPSPYGIADELHHNPNSFTGTY